MRETTVSFENTKHTTQKKKNKKKKNKKTFRVLKYLYLKLRAAKFKTQFEISTDFREIKSNIVSIHEIEKNIQL